METVGELLYPVILINPGLIFPKTTFHSALPEDNKNMYQNNLPQALATCPSLRSIHVPWYSRVPSFVKEIATNPSLIKILVQRGKGREKGAFERHVMKDVRLSGLVAYNW
jgi:hypothetical protein